MLHYINNSNKIEKCNLVTRIYSFQKVYFNFTIISFSATQHTRQYTRQHTKKNALQVTKKNVTSLDMDITRITIVNLCPSNTAANIQSR